MKTRKRTPLWAICFTIALLGCSAFVLLDAFVIPRPAAEAPAASQQTVTSQPAVEAQDESAASQPAAGEAVITDTSYISEDIEITVETVREYDTELYVVDIRLSNPAALQTALAQNTYGRNIKDTTSNMAVLHEAILAINGDYYGSRDSGYVIRGGVLYRDTARSAGDDEALVIDSAGNFSVIHESETSAAALLEAGAQQVLSFGPALVIGGQVAVDGDDEVAKSKSSNPRTAIGQVGEGHYIIIVSDGRTDESEGLTLLELAAEMAERGAQTAYNLDGGGSSTLVFNGEVINNPAGGRRGESERQVSDIVYVG